MTEKELKKLKNIDLLEMLIAQSREVEALRGKLEKAEKQLQDREIVLEKAGSIADAALRLNGVFEAAQMAAEQYLDSLAYLAEHSENHQDKMRRSTQKMQRASPLSITSGDSDSPNGSGEA